MFKKIKTYVQRSKFTYLLKLRDSRTAAEKPTGVSARFSLHFTQAFNSVKRITGFVKMWSWVIFLHSLNNTLKIGPFL